MSMKTIVFLKWKLSEKDKKLNSDYLHMLRCLKSKECLQINQTSHNFQSKGIGKVLTSEGLKTLESADYLKR